MECINWVVHATEDIFGESKKKVQTCSTEHQRGSIRVTGSHPAPLNTPKSAMENSTEFTQEQSL